MYFPLLESLLQKDLELSKTRVQEFCFAESDFLPLFKCLLTYAAQHEASDTAREDAVVVVNNVIKVIKTHTLTSDETNRLLELTLEFLVAMPTESVDTTSLKPDRHAAHVVSISDLEDAFEQDDPDVLFRTVRDLLSLMDNKQYFIELVAHIGLSKSFSSILVTKAIIEAVDIIEWTNHFAPFLLYHFIRKLFLDRTSVPLGAGRASFVQASQHVCTLDAVSLFDALDTIHKFTKISSSKIHPRIAFRLNSDIVSNPSGRAIADTLKDNLTWIELVALRASLSSFDEYPSLQTEISKIPFKI